VSTRWSVMVASGDVSYRAFTRQGYRVVVGLGDMRSIALILPRTCARLDPWRDWSVYGRVLAALLPLPHDLLSGQFWRTVIVQKFHYFIRDLW
jgi:hypothetical protein